jgi:phosphoribosyl-ATP pyrophosphohydrolase/phosphoribosyl-AMP cyclohydrolase
VDVSTDCDADAILVLADPLGPTCHKGTESCFAGAVATDGQRLAFLALLENIIANRIADQPEGSYTARLFAQGPSRIAQKLGEEGLETALASVTRDDEGVLSESADLVFHLLVLLKSRDLRLEDVVKEELRNKSLVMVPVVGSVGFGQSPQSTAQPPAGPDRDEPSPAPSLCTPRPVLRSVLGR